MVYLHKCTESKEDGPNAGSMYYKEDICDGNNDGVTDVKLTSHNHHD